MCSLCAFLLHRPKPIPFVLVVDFFFFLLWTTGSSDGGGGGGVFRSVLGKWACVCACGSGLVLVVGFFFFFFAVDCRWWWWLCPWLTVEVVEVGGVIFFW